MRYPSALASSSTPAPNTAEGISLWLNQELRAGEITATSGFSCSETSFAVIDVAVGRAGYALLPSNSFRLRLTIAGSGTNANTSTAATDVSMPLTISRVARKDTHACRVRGGSPLIATRRTRATRHNNGSTRTSGLIATFASMGTGGGSLGSNRFGCSGGGATSATSLVPITIFSMEVIGESRLQ